MGSKRSYANSLGSPHNQLFVNFNGEVISKRKLEDRVKEILDELAILRGREAVIGEELFLIWEALKK